MTAPDLARPATAPFVTTIRRLLRTLVTPMVWFWGIVVLAVVIITVVLASTGVTHISVVSFARQAGIWFPFSMYISIATVYLRVHVATGMTRRTFARAALVTAVVFAAANGLLMASGLWLERRVHGWLDWDWVLQDAALDPSGGSWPVMLLDYGLTYLVANACGLLCGVVYYSAGERWGPKAGGWWGTLSLPLTVGPVLVVLGLIAGLEGPWPDRATAYLFGNPAVSASVIAVVLAALVSAVFALIARRTAVARPHP